VLTLALSKGRIYDEAIELLSRIGIEPTVDPGKSRKLILPSNREGLQFLIIRASDVPTYVEYGAADLGIAGKDVLAEYETEGLYEPLDLGIASCRLMTAGRKGLTFRAGERPRVATKYVKTAHRFFANRGIQAEIIKLYGSMELAPLVGLVGLQSLISCHPAIPYVRTICRLLRKSCPSPRDWLSTPPR